MEFDLGGKVSGKNSRVSLNIRRAFVAGKENQQKIH
jgi:hypothetical protein